MAVTPAAPRGTVLIIEDDPVLADIVHVLLEEEGYTAPVLSTLTSDAVRVAIGQLEPDGVLLDVWRQADSTPSWQDAAWAQARQRAIPVILLTASREALREAQTGQSDRDQVTAFFAVVGKPFDLDELLAVVARAVGSVAPFDRSPQAETGRLATLVLKLQAAGARDLHPGTRREWATFSVGEALTLLYWSQRDGVYYVLRQPPEPGAIQQIGRFHDLDAAIALATLPP